MAKQGLHRGCLIDQIKLVVTRPPQMSVQAFEQVVKHALPLMIGL